MHWLSNGRQANGMVIRMQGFDRGLFGGNFHTHNWLPLLLGVDVVATSTGRDYARAMRHAVRQARAGRVVMMVDATYLLNLRDDGRDFYKLSRRGRRARLRRRPRAAGRQRRRSRVACVTWGTGVVAALRARKLLDENVALGRLRAAVPRRGRRRVSRPPSLRTTRSSSPTPASRTSARSCGWCRNCRRRARFRDDGASRRPSRPTTRWAATSRFCRPSDVVGAVAAVQPLLSAE